MTVSKRRDVAFPSWRIIETRASLALEARLRMGKLALGQPPELQPTRLPPRRKPLPLWRRAVTALLAAIVLIHLGWIFATSLLILAYRYSDPSVTVLMAYRKWADGWKLEKPRSVALSRVPGYLRSMLVAIEDDKFYEHHGIDPAAFKRAYEINARLKKPLYGGSTLTMQVARTLFLVPVKSYIRKYFEVIAALELELLLPKNRILELYFGYAEWGKGLFGIEAASRRYYGRGISKLGREEGARLIALLSSPIRFGPTTLQKSLILRERYAYLVHRYVSPGPSSPGTVLPSGAALDARAGGAVVTEQPLATPEPGEDAAAAQLDPGTP
jgi:monofunctional biosynthetic peptidoglycan transglycosylase